MAHLLEFWRALVALSQEHGRELLSLLLILIVWFARVAVLRIVEQRHTDIAVRYRWRKVSLYVAVMLGFVLVGRIWIHGIDSLTTYLGLLTAGLAVALQAPIVNMAGWLFLMWRRPFEVGDRIQIGDIRGDVIDLRIFMFTMMELGNWVDADQSTGRVVHVPNGRVFNQEIANYSQGFHYIWDELPILLTFESDWRKAKGLLEQLIQRHDVGEAAAHHIRDAAKRFLINYNNLTPIVYTAVKDSGVELTLRYLVEPRKRRGRRMEIWEEVLDVFAAHGDIDFAYPTVRHYRNPDEGKPGAGGPKQE